MQEWTQHCLDLVKKGRYPDGYVCGNIKIVVEKIDDSQVELSIYLVHPETGETLVNMVEIIVPEGGNVTVEPFPEVFSKQEHYLVRWPFLLDDVGIKGFPKLPSAFDETVDGLFDKDEKGTGNENTN